MTVSDAADPAGFMGTVTELLEQFMVLVIVKQHAGSHAVYVIIRVRPVNRARNTLVGRSVTESEEHLDQRERVRLPVHRE